MNTKKRVLSRDDLLNAGSQRVIEEVDIPELGGSVRVQGLTGAERDRYEGEILKRDRKTGQLIPQLTNARALLVAVALVDEEGKPLFSENELGLLGGVRADTLQRIWEKAAELSGMTEKDLDELEQSFGTALPGDNSSASQGTSDGLSLSSVKSSPAGS